MGENEGPPPLRTKGFGGNPNAGKPFYENDLVVDPFLGSGTTAVAAKRLNRRFVGCDEDEHCVNEAKRRLSEEITDHGG
jgi:hypothetical protein